MRLAEALILRADMMTKLNELRERIDGNILVQEGEEPTEDPVILLKQFEARQEDLARLIKGINRTNQATELRENYPLADALVDRDRLKTKHSRLIKMAEKARYKDVRYSQSEIKMKSMVDAKILQKKADAIAKEYRLLDLEIQQKNWDVDLIE